MSETTNIQPTNSCSSEDGDICKNGKFCNGRIIDSNDAIFCCSEPCKSVDKTAKKIHHWPYILFTPYTTIDFKNMPNGDITPERAFYFGRVLGSDGVFITARGLPNLVEGNWFEPLYKTEEEKKAIYQKVLDFQNIYSKYGVYDNTFHMHAHNVFVHPTNDVKKFREDIIIAVKQKAELMKAVGMKRIMIDTEFSQFDKMDESPEFWYNLGKDIMKEMSAIYPDIEFGFYPGLQAYYEAQKNNQPQTKFMKARHGLYKGLYDGKGTGRIWVFEAWTYGACDDCIREYGSVYVWNIHENVEHSQTMYRELLGPGVEIMVGEWPLGNEMNRREMKLPVFSKEQFERNLIVPYRYVNSIAFWDDNDDWDEDNAAYMRFTKQNFETWKNELKSVEIKSAYSYDRKNNKEHWIKISKETPLEEKLSYYRIFEKDDEVHVTPKLAEDFVDYVLITKKAAGKQCQNIPLYSEKDIQLAREYKSKGFFPNNQIITTSKTSGNLRNIC